MNYYDIIGLTAGALTSAGFLPQLIKAWRSKSTRDISLAMLLIIAIGVTLWLIYGFLMGAMPIIIANAVTLTFVSCIIGLKVRYR